MITQNYSQRLLLEKNGKPQLPIVYNSQPEQGNEGDEGGLNLGQLLAAVRRRMLVIVSVTTAVASAVLGVSLTNAPNYEAKFELLTEPVTVENKLTSTSSPLNETSEKDPNVVDETELKILQSPKLMSPIVKQIEAKYPSSGSPDLKISLVEKTNILEVSYQDTDPKKVEFVLDLVAKAYLRYSLEERQTDIRQGIKFVEGQLPQLRQQVEVLQEQIQKFRQQNELIDPEGQGKQLYAQLSGIVQQRLDTQTQLAKTQSLYASLQSQLKLQQSEAMAASGLSEAPRYQKLLNELQEIESKIAVESARYREDSPTIQALRAQQQNLLPLVEKEGLRVLGNEASSIVVKSRSLASPNSIRLQQLQKSFDAANQVQALKAQNQALLQTESILRQQFNQFPFIVRQNDDLERQLKIAVNSLNQFLTKREALRIDAAQKEVPWQLLTPPTEPESSSSIKLNLLLGATLGLLLGVGAALLIDKSKNVFYTPEEVKDTTKLQLLGEIPAQKHDVSQFWESLRSLYTNIRFLSFDAPVRSLAIISAAHEDGRSTIALHLAQTVAAMGQRVLLVDADLRSPKIHTMLNLPNTKGLSNIIAADLDFKDTIQQVNSVSMQTYGFCEVARDREPWQDTFFVLTAGQVPPNPTSLLSSQKMKNLAARFQAAFDLIIYDTSPFLGVADSSVLAVHTDASLLVVGLGKTDRSALLKVLEQFKISSTPVLGVVTNGIKV